MLFAWCVLLPPIRPCTHFPPLCQAPDASGDAPPGDVDTEGTDSSLIGGLASSVAATTDAAGAAIGLTGQGDEAEKEVRRRYPLSVRAREAKQKTEACE